jgi:hypothetical protein
MLSESNLYPTQLAAARFLLQRDAGALFASVGTGKSVMSMTAFAAAHYAGITRRALVVAPLAVAKFTWATEYRKWEHLKHLRVSLVVGTPKERQEALNADADLYVVNFDVLTKVLDSYPRELPWDTLIIDELSKLKDRGTKRWRMLSRRLGDFERRWGLTGTPTPNHLLELWPQTFVLDRGLGAQQDPPSGLGPSWTRFRSQRFRQTDWQGYTWEPKPGTSEWITERLRHLVFRASAQDMLGQKPHHEVLHEVALPPAVVRTYRQVERNAFAQVGDAAINAANAAVIAGKLLQVTSGAVYDENGVAVPLHSVKYEAVEAIVEELQGEPLLLVYSYQHELDEYMRRLPQAVLLTAQSPQSLIDAWNRNEIEVAITHSASLGHGVNLQLGGAHNLLFSSPIYSNERREQMIGRLHRQGQVNTVIVHDLAARLGGLPSIDHLVLDILRGKHTLQEGILRSFEELQP